MMCAPAGTEGPLQDQVGVTSLRTDSAVAALKTRCLGWRPGAAQRVAPIAGKPWNYSPRPGLDSWLDALQAQAVSSFKSAP